MICHQKNSLIVSTLQKLGFSLYKISYSHKTQHSIFINIFIEKFDKSSPSLGECSTIGKLLENIISINFPDQKKHIFSVSSVGIERKINKIEEYKFFINYDIKFQLLSEIPILSKTFIATVIKAQKKNILVGLEKNNRELTIPYNNIKSAQIVLSERVLKLIRDKKIFPGLPGK